MDANNKKMDKAKKPNRFYSPAKRQIKQSVSNDGGNVDVLERSKREKVLRFIGRSNLSKENSEIGGGFDGDEELSLSTDGDKRFKVHSKPLNECNAIDHAVVPRKLRSAMIKRSRESLSPPLPGANKIHHTSNGTQRPQINGAKKSKQKMKQGGGANQFLWQAESVPITKDEEEVAETLYALARMIPDDKSVQSQVDQKIPEAKSPPFRETMESPVLASEATKEANTKCHKAPISVEATTLPSTVEGSFSDAVKNSYLTESTVLDRPTILGKQKIDHSLSSTSLPDLNISPLSKSEHTNNTPLTVAVEGVSTELCHGTRSTQTTQHEYSFCEQKPELWPVASIGTKLGEGIIKENKDRETHLACIEGTSALSAGDGTKLNGGGRGAGLSMVWPHGGDRWLSSCKVPTWLDSATSATKPNSVAKDVSKEKVNQVVADRKRPLKRGATHVYISRLILEHRALEKMPKWEVPLDQIKPDGAKLGATEVNGLIGSRNGFNGHVSVGDRNVLNGVISVGGPNAFDSGKIMNEVQSGILKDKQSRRDFLSLSTCGGGMGSTALINDINQGGNMLDSSTQFRVPYLHPVVQNRQIMPFPVHGRPSFSPYPDQMIVAPAQQLQSPQHMGSPFYGTQHLIHGDPTKQQHQQQQHQQMWAAHYMPGGNSATHLPKWQNIKHDSPILIPSGVQPLLPTSSLPL